MTGEAADGVSEVARAAAARYARRAAARGFRFGEPRIWRVGGTYWCDQLALTVEIGAATTDPDGQAIRAVRAAAGQVDAAGAPASAVAVALAVMQAEDAAMRGWIVDHHF